MRSVWGGEALQCHVRRAPLGVMPPTRASPLSCVAPPAPSQGKGAYSPKAVYTLDELRGVVAYARSRAVRIVAEIEMPGHGSFSPGACSYCEVVAEAVAVAVTCSFDLSVPRVGHRHSQACCTRPWSRCARINPPAQPD